MQEVRMVETVWWPPLSLLRGGGGVSLRDKGLFL
jgi:hypothetical protein